MKISLCMIVRDEEEVLARCLKSVQNFVDEIVIVDTGSTDKTKEIARSFTDRIFDFEWVDDFSLARNFSFSRATGDYIIWLDADDIVEPKELKKLLELKKHITGDVDMYRLKYNIKFDENNVPTFSYFRERIIKNDHTFQWQDPIHEVITPHGKVVNLDIAISHKKIRPNAPMRNLKIYKKMIENKKPLSPRQKFYYARELMYNAFYKEAITVFEEFLKEKQGWIENNIEACQNLANCYKNLQNIPEALQWLFYSFNFHSPKSEILCDIGELLLMLHRTKEAIFWYELATQQKPNYNSGAFIQGDYYGLIPYLQLCVCYYKLGDLRKSEKYNTYAFKINPKNVSVLHNKKFFAQLKIKDKNKTEQTNK